MAFLLVGGSKALDGVAFERAKLFTGDHRVDLQFSRRLFRHDLRVHAVREPDLLFGLHAAGERQQRQGGESDMRTRCHVFCPQSMMKPLAPFGAGVLAAAEPGTA